MEELLDRPHPLPKFRKRTVEAGLLQHHYLRVERRPELERTAPERLQHVVPAVCWALQAQHRRCKEIQLADQVLAIPHKYL